MKHTLQTWNTNPTHREAFHEFLNTPTGIAFLDVLDSLTPRTPRVPGLDSQFLLVESGRTTNHLWVREIIQKMRDEIPTGDLEQVQADYSPENNKDPESKN